MMKLPTINLPTFSGKYNEWLSFWDLFSAAVDSNASLSPVQKLHYLKTSCKDDGLRPIASLSLIADNYETAKQTLKARFENKRCIVREHLHLICTQLTIKSETASQLRHLMENVTKNLQSLQAAGVPTGDWDPWLVYTVSEKLDPETRKQWELHLPGVELQSFRDLTDFINQRATALEFSQSVFTSSQKNVSVHSA